MYLCADGMRNLIENAKLIAPCGSDTLSPEQEIEQWKVFLKDQCEFIEGSGFDITIHDVFRRDTTASIPYIGVETRRLPEYISVSNFGSAYCNGDTYHLPPRYYLLQSRESVRVPNYLVGFVLPRSSFFNAECLVATTRISPGFSGQLRVGLSVQGSLGLKLDKGARFATVMLAQLTPGKTDSYKGIWTGSKLSTDNKEERGY